MEINAFANKVCKAMKKEFGEGYRVELKEICKNNGVILHGLLITDDSQNVIPTIYLDSFWEAYEGGVTFSEIIRRLLEIYRREVCGKSVNMEFFKDFEKVKDRICYRLVGKQQNEGLLEDIPHVDFLDLTICFFYAYQGEELGAGSILLHNSHLELWETTTEELMKLAEKNTPRLFPGVIFTMREVMEDLMREQKTDVEGDEQAFTEFLEDVPMKILSNEQRTHGAACVLYDGMLEEVAENYGKSFYVLPSSIHEVILLPEGGSNSEDELKEMIHDVNRTQVAPEEVLSDSLYYFDSAKNILKLIR